MQQENHNGIKRFDSTRFDSDSGRADAKQPTKTTTKMCCICSLLPLYYYDYSNNSNTKVLLPKKEKEDVFLLFVISWCFRRFHHSKMFCLSQVYLYIIIYISMMIDMSD